MALAKVVRGVQGLERKLGPTVVTVGTFDGVHRGHRLLIGRAIEEAGRLGVAASVVTWDRHPKSIVPHASAPPLLTSIDRKIELLAGSGLDLVVVLPLDEELRRWSPEHFVEEVFVGALDARAVIVGSDWRYGHRASGDVGLLRRLGRASGFRVVTLERSGRRADEASSTRARTAVARGQVESAGDLLGRPHELDATVVARAGATFEARIGSGFAVPPAGCYRGSLVGLGAGECVVHVEDGDRLRIEASGEAPPIGGSARLQFISRCLRANAPRKIPSPGSGSG
jgi:riboflavin kinase/FMN adenylyltransferase